MKPFSAICNFKAYRALSKDYILLNLSMLLMIATQSDFFRTQQAKYFISIFFFVFLLSCIIFKFLTQHFNHLLEVGFPLIFSLSYFETFGLQQKNNPYILMNFILYNILAVNNSSCWLFSMEIPFLGFYYFCRIVSVSDYFEFDIFPVGSFYFGLFFVVMSYKRKFNGQQIKKDQEECEIYKNLFLNHYPGKIWLIESVMNEVRKKNQRWRFHSLIKHEKKRESSINKNVKIQIDLINNSKQKTILYRLKECNKPAEEKDQDLFQSSKKIENFLEKLQPYESKTSTDFNDFVKHNENIEINKNPPYLFVHAETKEQLTYVKINSTSFLLFSAESEKQNVVNITPNIEKEIEELKKKLEIKDQILAAVSHDMRSPLNGIIYYIKSAKEAENANTRRQKLEFALTNTNLLLFLVNDLLDFSLFANNNSLKLNPTKFSLTNLLDEVLSLVSMEAKNKKIIMVLQNDCNSNLLLFSDERRMKQVLLNLLTNAIKFTFEGHVKLKVSMVQNAKNLILFEVFDTGLGIKPEIIPNLMKPFSSFDNQEKKANRNGIGLGLFICKTLVGILGPKSHIFIHSEEKKGTKIGFLAFIMNEAHEKDIEVNNVSDFHQIFDKKLETFKEENVLESDHRERTTKIQNINKNSFYNRGGRGSSQFTTAYTRNVSIEKLRVSSNTNITFHSEISAFSKGTMTRCFQNYPILIVDDQSFNLMILKDILLGFKDKNLIVESAANGSIAVEMFCKRNDPKSEDEPYTLILMDKEMPIMNGVEATKMIRNKIFKEGYKDLKIIGCTGDVMERDCEQNEFTGLDDYFVKPIDVEMIHSCLRKYLGGKI